MRPISSSSLAVKHLVAGLSLVALLAIALGVGCSSRHSSTAPPPLSGAADAQPTCNSSSDPAASLRCSLVAIDARGGLPKHLDQASLDSLVENIKALGEARLALRLGQITEAAFDKQAADLQRGCQALSGLSCSDILNLSVPE